MTGVEGLDRKLEILSGQSRYGITTTGFGYRWHEVDPRWNADTNPNEPNLFGWVADRQLGLRVRAFTPCFEEGGSLGLKTTGAYGVVRHPIYAAGLWYQVGVFLVTGVVAVAAAALVFGLGALWFTRQEEARLVRLLRDPAQYQRYRAAVPALLPWPRRRP